MTRNPMLLCATALAALLLVATASAQTPEPPSVVPRPTACACSSLALLAQLEFGLETVLFVEGFEG